jgi:hypothetical protein
LYFRHPRTAGSYTLSSHLKSRPSIPTDAHVSHSRTVSGSVVDGHNAQGADSRREAKHGLERGSAPPVRPSGRVGSGQPQQIERDEVGRPLARSPGCRRLLLGVDVGDQGLDAGFDLVADRPYGLDTLAGRVLEGQSRYFLPGKIGQASPQPIVMT